MGAAGSAEAHYGARIRMIGIIGLSPRIVRRCNPFGLCFLHGANRK